MPNKYLTSITLPNGETVYIESANENIGQLKISLANLQQEVLRLRQELDAIKSQNISDGIDSFEEIITSLEGIKENENIKNLIDDASVDDSLSFSDIGEDEYPDI